MKTEMSARKSATINQGMHEILRRIVPNTSPIELRRVDFALLGSWAKRSVGLKRYILGRLCCG